MKFSQRIGKSKVRQSLQIESIDAILENRLWNTFLKNYVDKLNKYREYAPYSELERICKIIWEDFFGYRIDEIPLFRDGDVHTQAVIEHIKQWFFNTKWYHKYDFIEFVIYLDQNIRHTNFVESCNETLKRESSGYRIVDNNIVQITSEEEILAIEEAIEISHQWKPVETHLKTALSYLSNRDNPDYRNSIKESISAVESICIILTGDKNATLGKALGLIEQNYSLHKALRNAFSALYGYTSDSGGIRHSLLEDDIEVTMEDAKFMLISCSAFINYLKSKK